MNRTLKLLLATILPGSISFGSLFAAAVAQPDPQIVQLGWVADIPETTINGVTKKANDLTIHVTSKSNMTYFNSGVTLYKPPGWPNGDSFKVPTPAPPPGTGTDLSITYGPWQNPNSYNQVYWFFDVTQNKANNPNPTISWTLDGKPFPDVEKVPPVDPPPPPRNKIPALGFDVIPNSSGKVFLTNSYNAPIEFRDLYFSLTSLLPSLDFLLTNPLNPGNGGIPGGSGFLPTGVVPACAGVNDVSLGGFCNGSVSAYQVSDLMLKEGDEFISFTYFAIPTPEALDKQFVNIPTLSAGVHQTPLPLPILGAGVALGFSRKIRQRIKTH